MSSPSTRDPGRPPQQLRPHVASAFREIFTQPTRGWRLGILVVVLLAGWFGGNAVDSAGGLRGVASGLAALGLMAATAALLALGVGVGRWRNARRR